MRAKSDSYTSTCGSAALPYPKQGRRDAEPLYFIYNISTLFVHAMRRLLALRLRWLDVTSMLLSGNLLPLHICALHTTGTVAAAIGVSLSCCHCGTLTMPPLLQNVRYSTRPYLKGIQAYLLQRVMFWTVCGCDFI